jgi:hypothetical protein
VSCVRACLAGLSIGPKFFSRRELPPKIAEKGGAKRWVCFTFICVSSRLSFKKKRVLMWCATFFDASHPLLESRLVCDATKCRAFHAVVAGSLEHERLLSIMISDITLFGFY